MAELVRQQYERDDCGYEKKFRELGMFGRQGIEPTKFSKFTLAGSLGLAVVLTVACGVSLSAGRRNKRVRGGRSLTRLNTGMPRRHAKHGELPSVCGRIACRQ